MRRRIVVNRKRKRSPILLVDTTRYEWKQIGTSANGDPVAVCVRIP